MLDFIITYAWIFWIFWLLGITAALIATQLRYSANIFEKKPNKKLTLSTNLSYFSIICSIIAGIGFAINLYSVLSK